MPPKQHEDPTYPPYFVQDRAKNRNAVLPEDADWAIVSNYDYVLPPMSALAERLLRIKSNSRYKKYLEVPAKYKRAYRLIPEIKPATLSSILGSEPINGDVQTRQGGRYTPHEKGITQSSWTVDKTMYDRMQGKKERYVGIEFAHDHCTPGTYVLLLEADLNAHRNQFLLNPDTIFSVISKRGAKTNEFLKSQREVICFGTLPLIALHYVYVPGAKKSRPELKEHTKKIFPRLGTKL